jgi:hypothetical protein
MIIDSIPQPNLVEHFEIPEYVLHGFFTLNFY